MVVIYLSLLGLGYNEIMNKIQIKRFHFHLRDKVLQIKLGISRPQLQNRKMTSLHEKAQTCGLSHSTY